MKTSDLFSALSNEIRLRCLSLMQLEGELCVCELTYTLDLSQPMISRHLAILRDAGLVSDRRSGQWIYYRIQPELDDWIKQIIKTTVSANKNTTPFKNDQLTLNEMPDRPDASCCT